MPAYILIVRSFAVKPQHKQGLNSILPDPYKGNAKLTHPELVADIPEPVLVLGPVAVEVHTAVHTTLKHLNNTKHLILNALTQDT